MISLKKTIFTGFAPNLDKEGVQQAMSFLLFPWKWKFLRQGDLEQKVEEKIKNFFEAKGAFVFDSGRTALKIALEALNPDREVGEVLIQSYTCVVVINAVKWAGGNPIFVDIDENFNMDPKDLKRKITPKTTTLIIQHTFGKPADLEKLLLIAEKYNLKVIEDCAHSFGAKYKNKFTGTFGDVGMFSFGSDKNISCVRGGALITNNPNTGEIIKQKKLTLPLASRLKVVQNLFYYPVFAVGRVLYSVEIGKILLALAKKNHLISRIIYDPEKRGETVDFYPARLPNALAGLLLKQLLKIDSVNNHRKSIAYKYHNEIQNDKIVKKPSWDDDSVWLRYTILIKNPEELHVFAKKRGIILGNWYDCPVAPKDIDLEATGYKLGTCPNEEKIAQMSINLPTDPSISTKDADRIIKEINLWK